MSIPKSSSTDAHRRLAEGSAILVDIREPLEHAREAIPSARSEPLSKLDPAKISALRGDTTAVIFHCQSGKRTGDNASQLASCPAPQIFLLEGG